MDRIMRVITGLDELEALVGTQLGVSEWLTITQDMIDRFADVTLDPQWIHVDADRAARESPYGTTIAHGFLTLSLIPYLGGQIAEVQGIVRAINYGVNKVRFPNAVRCDARVRGVQTLLAITREAAGSMRYTSQFVVEIDGETKPACVAETVTMLVARPS
jgi:acyl dehydratase